MKKKKEGKKKKVKGAYPPFSMEVPIDKHTNANTTASHSDSFHGLLL